MKKHINIITAVSILALYSSSMAVINDKKIRINNKKETVQKSLKVIDNSKPDKTTFEITKQIIGKRFIIKYKTDHDEITETDKPLLKKLSNERILSQKSSGVSNKNNLARISHKLTDRTHVVVLDSHLDKEQVRKFIASAQEDSNVAYIEEDRIMKVTSMPVQVNPDWQWDMMTLRQFTPNLSWIGDNFVNAWKTLANHDYTPGANVIVAVIDTGYTPHPNFINNLQTLDDKNEIYGYQFISDCRISGECPFDTPESDVAQVYKKDGLDLGDGYELCDEEGWCIGEYSSWHGSHVTGTIIGSGYNKNNKYSIAGGAYGAKVVPVRVLGKGGGYTSDVVSGMLWAAGLPVQNIDDTTVPLNPNPAHVISLSLGGYGPCSSMEQDAIDQITSKGIAVVVAAGNARDDFTNYSPANCKGVISVAAKGPTNLAWYSNFGATTITASGGSENTSMKEGVLSTIWSSLMEYKSTDHGAWAVYQGTSMATPHVSAAIAILISILKIQNKSYTTEYITQILQKTAKKYNNCNLYGCADGGALDVDTAVKYILTDSSPNHNVSSNSDSNSLTALLILLGIGAGGVGGICLFNHYK